MTFADRFYFIVNHIPRLSRSSRIYQQSKDYFAQPRFQSWGIQFLGLGYYCPIPKKLERYTELGAVYYPHQTPTKQLDKKLGVTTPKFWGS